MTTSKSDVAINPREIEWAFQDALTYIPIHNHLIRAYHANDMYASAPPHSLMWRVPVIDVPTDVRSAVDADVVIFDIKLAITKARQAVKEVRSILEREVEHLIYHSPDRPLEHLRASVTVVHHITPRYAPAWSYTYNPYLLAMAVLDSYEHFIDVVRQRSLTPFTQLSYIHQKSKMLESDVYLVTSEMWRSLIK